MAQKLNVAVFGASGETGTSIVNGILALPDQFSLEKQQYIAFSERGVTLKAANLKSVADLRQSLAGMDVVISCLTTAQAEEERKIAMACKEAGVGRFVPSFFGPCCPPRGVFSLRDMKEDMLDYIKQHYIPYTVIDIGWWYQLSLPRLPSGKIDSKLFQGPIPFIGDGNTEIAFTDNRDIGKYVARIIADPRTMNRQVFAYGELRTQNDFFNVLEQVSGELVPRDWLSADDLNKIISDSQTAMAQGSKDFSVHFAYAMAQYEISWGIRGDNSPQRAKYLGYLDAKELYPDVEVISVESYLREFLDGDMKAAYGNRAER